MGLLNDPHEESASSQQTSTQNFPNNRDFQPAVTDGRALQVINNNRDEYKADARANGIEKVAEDDPLTGHSNWDEAERPTKPHWAQRFATTQCFMIVFLFAFILQGCYFTYFVSVITTIEKLFNIKSATIALLLNFSEVGQLCTTLLMTYFAGTGHRPRWIACGMFFFSIAAFMSVSPHFLLGSQIYNHDAVLKNEHPQLSAHTSFLPNGSGNLTNLSGSNNSICLAPDAYKDLGKLDPSCYEDVAQEKNNKVNSLVLTIFAVSLFGIGIGQTAIMTLGIPFIDDNVRSKQSAMYISITIGMRILGPAFGYYLGSLCIRQYVVVSMDVDHTHPNFIGAWWLGLLIVAISMFVSSLIMFLFPSNLRKKSTQVLPAPSNAINMDEIKTDKGPNEKQDNELNEDVDGTIQSKIADFVATIKRQLKNDILMFRAASAICHLFPMTGTYVFLPKYLENQFQMPTHTANFVSGTCGILVMGIGIIITGILSQKFSLTARKVSLWMAMTALAASICFFLLSMIGCPLEDIKGLNYPNLDGSNLITPPCTAFNTTCLCDNEKFAPICGSDGYTYFSACHAGCKFESEANGKKNFLECSCIVDTVEEPNASIGFCDNGRCDTRLIIFLIIFALCVFIHSTGEVHGVLIIMRCTHPKDKSIAMGVIHFATSLLSNIPCPNIYARIIDATCVYWSKICGKNGYCSLYNSETFRTFFFGLSACIMFLAFLFDMTVFFKAHRIDIAPESHEAEEKKGTLAIDQGDNLLNKRKKSQNEA